MAISRRVSLENSSDQELLALASHAKHRTAVAELYERYRVPIGRYLHRDIKSKAAVVYAFNTIIHRLVSGYETVPIGVDLSVKLFSMAYQAKREYIDQRQKADAKIINNHSDTQTTDKLSTPHNDVLELLYRHDFSIEQTANILGCTTATVRHCLVVARQQYLCG